MLDTRDSRAWFLLQKFGAAIMVSQGRRDFQGLPGSDSGAENTISLSQNKGKSFVVNLVVFLCCYSTNSCNFYLTLGCIILFVFGSQLVGYNKVETHFQAKCKSEFCLVFLQ